MRRCLALALMAIVLAIALPAPASAQDQDQVTVTITCRGGDNAPIERYAPDPYIRTLSQPAAWVLVINRPNDNYVRIQRKGEERWPYTEDSYSNEDDRNGRLTIPADQFTGDEGTFYYEIVYTCDGVEYTIDPRMDVGRGGGE